MSDLPDWIYVGAEVLVYNAYGARHDAQVKKVLKINPKTFNVEGPNSVSQYRFQRGRLEMQNGSGYGATTMKLEPLGTPLANELIAEKRRDVAQSKTYRAIRDYERAPSVKTANDLMGVLNAYIGSEERLKARKAEREAIGAER